jgi:hypothetical protein
MGLACILLGTFVAERGIRVFAMDVEQLWACVWGIYPVGVEEVAKGRRLVRKGDMGRGDDADNKRNGSPAWFWERRSGDETGRGADKRTGWRRGYGPGRRRAYAVKSTGEKRDDVRGHEC